MRRRRKEVYAGYHGLRARIGVDVDIYNCTKRKRKKCAQRALKDDFI